MSYPLEDFYEDILSKAQRGLNLTDEQIVERAGISSSRWAAMKNGEFDREATQRVASYLGLDEKSLLQAGEKSWVPEVDQPENLEIFTTTWRDMTVNAYVVVDRKNGKAAIFDSGADVTGMLEFLKKEGLSVEFIFITHSHGDHVADLDRLIKETGAVALTPKGEEVDGAEAFEPGKIFDLGDLEITTRLTFGHSRAGVSYIITGQDRPLAIVGDALFAGSMGGPNVDYQGCLRTNRAELFTLPDETVVCPGHGCLTTIGQEKKNNPFFAASFQKDSKVWT